MGGREKWVLLNQNLVETRDLLLAAQTQKEKGDRRREKSLISSNLGKEKITEQARKTSK